MSSKEMKEAFVTGHTGTTASEILLVCMSAPIGILLFHEIRNYCNIRNKYDIPKGALIVMESITVLLPMAICQTQLLFPYGVTYLSFELSLGLLLFIYRRYVRKNQRGYEPREQSQAPSSLASSSSKIPKMEFLSFYRSTVSYLTFVAILAVDFTIFPRSYAKTEEYGYGLMDLGAASFCVIGGLVSWFSRSDNSKVSNYNNDNRIKSFKEGMKKYNDHHMDKMKKVIVHSIPLLIMGMIRFITTKGLEYQEHVSEYGVHWNFFFTLALVNCLSTFIRSYMEITNPIFPWMILMVLYQLILSLGDVQDYIVNAPRVCVSIAQPCNFFAANREGILGSIGYLIIFLACEDIGRYCIWDTKFRDSFIQGKRLFIITITFWFLHWFASSNNALLIAVSRRSTNAPFILWTIAHNMTILFLIWVAFYYCSKGSIHDAMTKREDHSKVITPPIFAAVNKHGLIVFILANLLTGIVNLSVDTLMATEKEAIVIIFLYLCSVGGVSLLIEYILNLYTVHPHQQ